MRPYTPDDAAKVAPLDEQDAKVRPTWSGLFGSAPGMTALTESQATEAELDRLRATVARVEALSWEMSPEQGRRLRAALEGDR